MPLENKLDIKLRQGKGYRYIAVHNFALAKSEHEFEEFANKDETKEFVDKTRAKIELALEQLKDIEKMSEEL